MPLTRVVGRDMEQTRPQELRLLRRSVEGGDQDGLAAAAFAENCDLLLKHSRLESHERNVLRSGSTPDRRRTRHVPAPPRTRRTGVLVSQKRADREFRTRLVLLAACAAM